LQRLLNRVGALLDADGVFGQGTDDAVREAQQQAGLPATGAVDEATWAWLQAQPDPSPDIPVEAIVFLVAEEVGSRRNYDAKACHPHFPGRKSGVTIGIGYDLRHQTASFDADWGGELAPAVMNRLRPYLGKQGTAEAVTSLSDISVPFPCAWRVLIRTAIPRYVTMTRDAFPGFDALPPLCRGVLVSLVYNRGTDMDGDSRTEMRQIRDSVDAGDPNPVPAALRAMKRLWPDTPGLQTRRDKEAALWERGLAGGAEA
jgi:hypothetical protein